MKDRIAHIMRSKNLKATDFAAKLGIQPSGVSHILAGRNKPSLDFVKKIKETFPEYNLDWIIFGKGPMTTSEPFKESFKESPKENGEASGILPFDLDPLPEAALDDTPASAKELSEPLVKSIVFFYEDGTFDTFSPR